MTEVERFDRLATLYNLVYKLPSIPKEPIITAMVEILGVDVRPEQQGEASA